MTKYLTNFKTKYLTKYFSKYMILLKNLAPTVREYVALMRSAFFTADLGRLSWYYLFKLAIKNLLRSFSRTSITIGAIASGTAAIVFLVGFAYGLQSIVSDRLIQPNSLRLADIQSGSTALKIDQENLEKISQSAGVEVVAPAMSLAGTLKYNDSKTEVIVIGARNAFMNYSNIEMIAGEVFSEEAESAYEGEVNDVTLLISDVEGSIAGVSTSSAVASGDKVENENEINIRIQDDSYIPLRSAPELSAPIIGYVKGSLFDSYKGTTYWGDSYPSTGVHGMEYRTDLGKWLGKWILVDSVSLYHETAPTVYLPIVSESGSKVMEKGYLTFEKVAILTKADVNSEKMINSLLEEQGIVLGDATESSEATESSLLSVTVATAQTTSATDEAALLNSIMSQKTEEATVSATTAIVTVPRSGGKEIIVSTGLLNIWQIKPEDVINQTMSLGYIISGGVIPGLNGRVAAEEIIYKVVGVFKDDEKAIVYVPLSDLESMGINKYSIAKVLSTSPEILQSVREKIESIGFNTQSIADTLSQVNRLFGIMRFLLGSFGMIAFIVALFGMFNTLTVSLLERIREIGVMKTLGTTDSDVVRLLLVESTVIGVTGGFFGIILGILLGGVVDLILILIRKNSAVSLFDFPFTFLFLIFMLSVVVGVLTGLYPAKKARNISALNALRYE